MPVTVDLTGPFAAYRGDVYDHTFVLENDGEPWDLTGYQVRAQWRPYVRSVENQWFDTSDSQLAAGRIVIALTAAQTYEMVTDGVYDLKVIDPDDGASQTLFAGRFETHGNVTRGDPPDDSGDGGIDE